VTEVERVLQDVLIIGHGGVGTLLVCHFNKLEIDRRYDQPAGDGNMFSVDVENRKALNGWNSMDEL